MKEQLNEKQGKLNKILKILYQFKRKGEIIRTNETTRKQVARQEASNQLYQ